jgi:hypothetical protein
MPSRSLPSLPAADAMLDLMTDQTDRNEATLVAARHDQRAICPVIAAPFSGDVRKAVSVA